MAASAAARAAPINSRKPRRCPGAADGGGGGGGTPSADDADTEYQVDGMVFNLKRFKQSGVTSPSKANGVVYRLGTRKLQLSIRNSPHGAGGQLLLDFLEYLSKAALWGAAVGAAGWWRVAGGGGPAQSHDM